MPCLHPHSRLSSRNHDTGKPRKNNERAIRFSKAEGRSSIHRGPRPRIRDHAPVVSDTWLSEAASEFRPSWREARRLMLEAHRPPESARFVEADSGGVKPER